MRFHGGSISARETMFPYEMAKTGVSCGDWFNLSVSRLGKGEP